MPDKQEPQPQLSPQDVENAKDLSHPAHPDHPKHGEWAKSLPKKLGNAAVFGAGAQAGADVVKGIVGQ